MHLPFDKKRCTNRQVGAQIVSLFLWYQHQNIFAFAVPMASSLEHSSKVDNQSNLSVKFGPHLRAEFPLEDGYTNLNHGSYGSTPHFVTKAAHRWQSQMEACPDRWFRQTLYPELDRARAELAKYVNADPMDLVFVENASHGNDFQTFTSDSGLIVCAVQE
jgi:hypothetical protein